MDNETGSSRPSVSRLVFTAKQQEANELLGRQRHTLLVGGSRSGKTTVLINAIVERTPTGAGKGQRNVKKGRNVNAELGRRVAIEGASVAVCKDLGIPPEWSQHCEDAFPLGHSN